VFVCIGWFVAMGLEAIPPVMSTLNPNASEFVPVARRVVVEESRTPVSVAPPVVVEEYSDDWWSLFESDEVFRAQYMSSISHLSAEQRNALVEDLAELADYDQFEEHQEHLEDLEEEDILARNLREMGRFLRS
jgi:DNA-directed RNA polymerase subunit F